IIGSLPLKFRERVTGCSHGRLTILPPRASLVVSNPMRVLILRCGDAPLPDDLPGTVLDLPAVPDRRDLKLLDDAAANLLPEDPTPTLDEISAQPDVPHLATPGPAPQAEHLPEALRV